MKEKIRKQLDVALYWVEEDAIIVMKDFHKNEYDWSSCIRDAGDDFETHLKICNRSSELLCEIGTFIHLGSV